MPKFIDDEFQHLESDIEKIRVRHRQYISYSNEAGAKSVVDEIINNALDECRTPRSPGDKIHIKFDERSGFIEVVDNGRGIPTNIIEKLFTSLNMGSNIKTSNKAGLKAETLGQNGTGTLAICGLGERTEITSYRGGSENVFKRIVFEEGQKVHEEEGKCNSDKHGMSIIYKPSKVMGKNTRIIWNQVYASLLNLQYLLRKKINISSEYIDNKGIPHQEKYKIYDFDDILLRNEKDSILSNKISMTIEADDIIEEIDGEKSKKFLSMDVAFAFTSSITPYIDSFSNSNNTVDNGDHLDGTLEALCRYLQQMTKNSLSEKEKNNLDIKWDDIKSGLSIVVALRTNYESLYTGQTKHKVVSAEIKKIIQDLVSDALVKHFDKKPGQLKDVINIIKMNAKARREGDKVRSAVVKGSLTNWSSYKMKNYDPCTNKGKEYKELWIIEGDSAKGSLKKARDPRFQALFAIRGVSANVFKLSLDQIVGPNGNKEFNDLISVMGCNVGLKFDLSKLQFDKIIIASDADVDGLFIRSLLMAFFFKLFPEIIKDGRLFIAEPPLYRVDDKKNPFVINKDDYVQRYIRDVIKAYKIATCPKYTDEKELIEDFFTSKQLEEFLSLTSAYVDEMVMLSQHYKINERFLEIVLISLGEHCCKSPLVSTTLFEKMIPNDIIQNLNVKAMNIISDNIAEVFPEIYYDEKDGIFKGVIDGKYQSIEISDSLIRRSLPLIKVNIQLESSYKQIVLKDKKTGTEIRVSPLECLKILRKFQPNIIHRFKGLGENEPEDIKITLMDPNTRCLIRVQTTDIDNDMKTFQILRGSSPLDAQARKAMMREYRIPRDLIDT